MEVRHTAIVMMRFPMSDGALQRLYFWFFTVLHLDRR
jgi:hypothetical protein